MTAQTLPTTGITTVHALQLRLAQHYLNKLRDAANAVSQGRANLAYGLRLFDQEWPQIQHWQAHAVQYSRNVDEWSNLCKAFPIAGLSVLGMRQSPADRRDWWEAALEAAQRIQDQEAERTILPQLAMALSGLGDLEKTEQCARRLLELAHDARDPLHLGKAFYHLGTILEDQGSHAEAAQHYTHALEIFSKLRLEIEQGRALLGLGSIATITGEYLDAYTCFMEYLKIVETAGKESDLCIALMAVSEALRYLKRHDEIEAHLQRSIQICRMLGYYWALGPSLIAMGVCATEQDNLAAARAYLEEGVQVARTHGSVRDSIYGLSSLGYAHYRAGNFPAAIDCLQEGLTMAGEAGMPYFTCYVQRNLAYTYMALGSLNIARQALIASLTIASDLALLPETIKALTCAVAYGNATGQNRQSAIWAGFLQDKPDVDLPEFQPVCQRLEAALGTNDYQYLLAKGEALTLESCVSDALRIVAGSDQETPSVQAS